MSRNLRPAIGCSDVFRFQRYALITRAVCDCAFAKPSPRGVLLRAAYKLAMNLATPSIPSPKISRPAPCTCVTTNADSPPILSSLPQHRHPTPRRHPPRPSASHLRPPVHPLSAPYALPTASATAVPSAPTPSQTPSAVHPPPMRSAHAVVRLRVSRLHLKNARFSWYAARQ